MAEVGGGEVSAAAPGCSCASTLAACSRARAWPPSRAPVTPPGWIHMNPENSYVSTLVLSAAPRWAQHDPQQRGHHVCATRTRHTCR